jgi:hypothetical protein
MAVISKPLSAGLSFRNSAKERVQSLGKLRTDLQNTQVSAIFSAINAIRGTNPGQPVAGGLYTVTEELTEI